MLYTLATLTVIAAIVLLAAVIGLLPRIGLTRGEKTIIWLIITLHIISMLFSNIQVMAGALSGIEEEDIARSIWIAIGLRCSQIIASCALIYKNIEAYMKDNGGE